jgi:hypothetical protein
MPHPEHAVEDLTGPGTDGLGFFTSILTHLAAGGLVAAGMTHAHRHRRRRAGPLPTSSSRTPSSASSPTSTRIRDILGRRPTSAELAMYSVMWSEHCSYKSSKVHLRQFGEKKPETDALLVGIGENAGVVDIGDGWAVTFKVESHNHPSYVEPYQGAATGVGGIVRDISPWAPARSR